MKISIGSDSNNGQIKTITLTKPDGTEANNAIDGNSAASILSGKYPLDWTHIDLLHNETAQQIFKAIQKQNNLMQV